MAIGDKRRPLDDPAAPYLIDFVEVGSTGARIGITPCPGTGRFPSAREGWQPSLAADLDVIAAWGAAAMVTLIEAGEPAAPLLEDLRRESGPATFRLERGGRL